MTSIQVPTQDLVPSVTSRIVTIDVTDMQEGAPGEGWIDFILPVDLHVAADDKIIKAGAVRVTLNQGKGQVRLPTYDPDAKREDGSDDWGIIVRKSWASGSCKWHAHGCACGGGYLVRVPAGTGSISLADLAPVRPLRGREKQYAITGVGVTITEGTQAGGTVSYTNGQLDLRIQVPAFRPETVYPYIDQTIQAARWAKGDVTGASDLDTYLTPGRISFPGAGVSNRPVAWTPGFLDVTVTGGVVSQEWTTLEARPQRFVRTRTGDVWGAWLQLVYTLPISITSGTLDTYTAPGSYRVTVGSVGGKPVTGLGWLEVIPMPANEVLQRFTPYNVAAATYIRSYVSGKWTAWTSTAWWNGGLPAGTEFDTLVTPGVHDVQFINHPGQPTPRSGTLTVTRGGTITVQTFEPSTGEHKRYRRRLMPTGWEAWAETGTNGATPTPTPEQQRPLSTWVPSMAAVPAAEIPRVYTADRMVAFNGSHSFGMLRSTRDDGATWTDMHTFPEAFAWVMPLADGELLASVGTDPSPRSLWKSTGYSNADPAAATWAKVLDASAPYIYFANAWGVSAYENIVIVAEYGPKTPTWSEKTITDPARYVYLSLDYGATWTTAFDLVGYLTTDRGLSTTDGQHLHGVAWDPWWDRIWVTFGDDTSGTVFSDDLGKTWNTADWGPNYSSPWQAVGIVPMENCILLGSDSPPNGVWRINRAPGKHAGAYTIEDAWTVPDDPGRLAFLCQAIQRVPAPGGGDAAILFGFGTETRAGRTFIVGTRDGYHFTQVWQDDLELPAGRGIRSIAGPNLRGDLIVGSNDGRAANTWTEWRGPAPTY